MTPEKMAAFQKAQSGLAGALCKLMVVVQNFPVLKANQNFLELERQLDGTENRINVERNRYNEMVGGYNIFIRKFPTSLIASFRGFKDMLLYKAEAGSEKAPKVEF
jgi:LemA protein